MTMPKALKIAALGIVGMVHLFLLGGCTWINKRNHSHHHAHYSSSHRHDSNNAVINTDEYMLEKCVPSGVSLGEHFEYNYRLTPKEGMSHIALNDTIPEGAEYISSNPEATMDGDNLTWGFHHVRKGECKEITVCYKARDTGQLRSCATVTAVPIACTCTMVGEPILSVIKTGPKQARIGDCVDFKVCVKNEGNCDAHEVVLRDFIPAGLKHASGHRELCEDLGTLKPCDVISRCYRFEACSRGNHCNKVQVTSCNAKEVEDEACVMVVEPCVEVTKTGPEEQWICKDATYVITVTNPGDMTLHDIEVVDYIPGHADLKSAPGACIHGNQVVWTIPILEKDESKMFELTYSTQCIGTACNCVDVCCHEKVTSSAKACTEWKGHPALSMEVRSKCASLHCGVENTYTICVTNQGSAPDTNVAVVVKFPNEVKPTKACGPSKFKALGRTIMFAPVEQIEAGERLEYRVIGVGEAVGDGRVIVELTSNVVKDPLTKEESTQVY